LLDALGLSGTLYADPRRALDPPPERRRERYIREHRRVGKEAIAKARPIVAREMGRKEKRWVGSTPEARTAAVQKMNAARLAKRRSATSPM
jgi:hypothetical protein